MGIMQCSTHVGSCTGDVNTRKPSDKRVFFGLQDTTVPRRSGMAVCTQICVMGAGVPKVGPRGVNSGYGHPVSRVDRGHPRCPMVSPCYTVLHCATPCYTEVSHGVTVGCR